MKNIENNNLAELEVSEGKELIDSSQLEGVIDDVQDGVSGSVNIQKVSEKSEIYTTSSGKRFVRQKRGLGKKKMSRIPSVGVQKKKIIEQKTQEFRDRYKEAQKQKDFFLMNEGIKESRRLYRSVEKIKAGDSEFIKDQYLQAFGHKHLNEEKKEA
ncbi:hypothetical protein COB57_01955 [Candidatus Peregrinibacteria bacterium]|nr:MAG: hypothetical protein COB57_01955 [Candidatus Peregrinibacteria bacterium]